MIREFETTHLRGGKFLHNHVVILSLVGRIVVVVVKVGMIMVIEVVLRGANTVVTKRGMYGPCATLPFVGSHKWTRQWPEEYIK